MAAAVASILLSIASAKLSTAPVATATLSGTTVTLTASTAALTATDSIITSTASGYETTFTSTGSDVTTILESTASDFTTTFTIPLSEVVKPSSESSGSSGTGGSSSGSGTGSSTGSATGSATSSGQTSVTDSIVSSLLSSTASSGSQSGSATGTNSGTGSLSTTASTGSQASGSQTSGSQTGTATGTNSGTDSLSSTASSGSQTGSATGTNSGTDSLSSTASSGSQSSGSQSSTGSGSGTQTGTASTGASSTIGGTSASNSGTPSASESSSGASTTASSETRLEDPSSQGSSTASTGGSQESDSKITTAPATTTKASETAPAQTTATTTADDDEIPAFVSSQIVVGGSITVPPQTAVATGSFDTTTLTDKTGSPSSWSETTTTDDDHNPTILPVWFNGKGNGIIVFPKIGGGGGGGGIIPPPPGLPTIVIGPGGKAQEQKGDGEDNKPTKSDSEPTKSDSESTKSEPKSTDSATKTTASESETTTQSSATSSETTSTESSSTSEPTSSPTGYVIIPKDKASKSDRTAFGKKLAEQVKEMDTVDDSELGVAFWVAPLNSTQVKDIGKESSIDSVFENKKVHNEAFDEPSSKKKRSITGSAVSYRARSPLVKRGEITAQPDAPEDITLVSTPEGQSPLKDFSYDSKAGEGITVYVVDSGANTAHEEYANMPGKKDFVIAGVHDDDDEDAFDQPEDTDKDDKLGHGTCVLAKVAAPTYGIAKKVDTVMIKIELDKNGFAPISDVLKGIIAIKNHMTDSKVADGKAVINLSLSLETKDSDQMFVDFLKKKIQEFVDKDVVVVVAAGNSGEEPMRSEVDTYPQLLAKDITSMIIVGATDITGEKTPWSQGGPLVDTYAVGEDIKCPTSTGKTGETEKSGTSFAAPQVAGLAAYFMSLGGDGVNTKGSVAANVKKAIKEAAYPRIKDGKDPLIWNKVTPDCKKSKRDGSGSCELATSATSQTKTSATATSSGSKTSSVASTLSTSVKSSSGTASKTDSKTDSTTQTESATKSGTTTTSAASTKADSTTKSEASKTSTTSEPTSTSSGGAECSEQDPPGVVTKDAQDSIDKFCDALQFIAGDGSSSEDDTTGSILLTSQGSTTTKMLPKVSSPYYILANTMVLQIEITKGKSYRVTKDGCGKGFAPIMDKCSKGDGDKKEQFGGSATAKDAEDEVKFSITMEDAVAIGK